MCRTQTGHTKCLIYESGVPSGCYMLLDWQVIDLDSKLGTCMFFSCWCLRRYLFWWLIVHVAQILVLACHHIRALYGCHADRFAVCFHFSGLVFVHDIAVYAQGNLCQPRQCVSKKLQIAFSLTNCAIWGLEGWASVEDMKGCFKLSLVMHTCCDHWWNLGLFSRI